MARETDEITNSEDTIDSRDIEARIAYLEDEREAAGSEEQECIHCEKPVTWEPNSEENIAKGGIAGSWILEDGDYGCESSANGHHEVGFDPYEQFDESDEGEELKTLKELRDDVGSSEWTYGLQLIRESYWVEYVQELVADIGDMPRDIPSYIEIDWDATANNVQQDYSSVEFNNVTYYYRSC